MRHSLRLLAGTGAVVAALAATAGPAQASPAPAVLSTGHVDAIDVAFEDGALELAIHDGTTDTEFAPADAVLLVKPAAKTAVPDDPAYAFLGPAGAPVWVLPQVQNPDLLYAGLSAAEVEPGVLAADTVRINLLAVRGPGDIAVFTQDAVGTPAVLADDTDGLPDTLTLQAGQHEHANWAFDRAGTYRLTVTASAELAATGETVTSDPAVFTFTVRR
ncbi:choice-of-anchor M domain-containing protein [Catenuloplanes atrovinosus]|uniref:Surface-anchored protein n=1 Tax=Catenuloplanes atrovinosus TaxID=137266 RepID=A0AAE4CB03_9ACTN|nr:choice-of-anchor M domain-containing protein [Catenuloplanes atrovinosus]MDR7277542.1 surface-anchored protein [Catenuloplanes atrovinosus]